LPRLVVFDLDGTITRRDTLVPYVVGLLAERPRQLARLLRIVPPLLAFLCGRIGLADLKGRAIAGTLGGTARADIERRTRRFVPSVLARMSRRDALAAIERHRRAGDRLVLLSASPDLYVHEIGAALNFDETICTAVRWDGESLQGGLAGPNCRGAEKTRRIAALRERFPERAVVAYANSAGDLDHLRAVETPLLVCGSWLTRRRAARLGIPTACWR